MTIGGRNLALLGLGATAIAIATTSVSLFIYRASGDIYLDRSRPGFMPDESEAATDTPAGDNYQFSDSGKLDANTLSEYLTEFNQVINSATDIKDPYSASALSDESLGITAPSQDSSPESSSAP